MVYADCHPDRPNYAHSLCYKCYQKQYHIDNMEKRNENARERSKIPEAIRMKRDSEYRRLYNGFTMDDYDKLLEEQGNVCAICKKEDEKWLCVDHDHKTGEVRGLLCRKCNLALGHFDDDPKRMQSAIIYLKGE